MPTTLSTDTIVVTTLDTPAGPVRIAERRARPAGPAAAVVALAFADHFDRIAERVRRAHPDATWQEGEAEAAAALRRYLAGELHALDDLVVDAPGTEFQHRVWQALRTIPVGATWSYAELAAAVGAPTAVRAVGTANGANPAWLVVPCHRVVRSDGSLGGYGGGIDRKAWLLQHEHARPIGV